MTGTTGFLGAVLASVLRNKQHEISTLASNGASRIDITRPFTLSNDNYDIVVHAAGKAHFLPRNERDKQEFYNVNYDGTKNLCQALEKLNRLPKSFIFISTVAVYGLDQGENISEEFPLNGNTPYADSKILAEEWLESWATDNHIELGILRLPLVAGPNPLGNLRAMIAGLKSGKYLSIGRADARKSMVWAEDIADIIPTLAEKGGIYNLTDGYHPSFRELEATIVNVLGYGKPLRIPIWLAKSLALFGDITGGYFPINSDKLTKISSTLTFDDSKARKELGWKPTGVLSKVPEIIKL